MAEQTKTPLIEAGCAWKKVSQKSGEKFLSIKVNLKHLGFDKDVELIGFSNKHKTTDAHPDLKFYFSTPREQRGNVPQQNTVKAPVAPKPVATPEPVPTSDDDMLI